MKQKTILKVLSLIFILLLILNARLPAQDILQATQKGDVKTVKAILSENPDFAKTKDKWGRTLLHFAVDINNVEIIECLIGSGANVDAIDKYA